MIFLTCLRATLGKSSVSLALSTSALSFLPSGPMLGEDYMRREFSCSNLHDLWHNQKISFPCAFALKFCKGHLVWNSGFFVRDPTRKFPEAGSFLPTHLFLFNQRAAAGNAGVAPGVV